MKYIEKELKKYVEDRGDIELAFLFGSVVSGANTAISDIDVAILFDKDSLPDGLAQLKIEDKLTSELQKEVDLVLLNNSSPIIRMQVLRKGKKIYEKNRKAYSTFFVRAINEYDDLKRVRAVIEKKILQGRVYD